MPADLLEHVRAVLGDRYAVIREIGRGGMATVYLAEDRKQGRTVALKVMRADLGRALGGARFLREIQIAGQLQHPNILGLYDSGTFEGEAGLSSPYFVMPYVSGESLRSRLDRETYLPLNDALRIATQVAEALAFAHSHGVIHRDIKPENILISDGHAIVADFGIAKALASVEGENLTETGLVLGTPHYMSPEQASATAVLDGRSDVYALGCVLYEMLAGQPPYTGPSSQVILMRHAVDPVPSLRNIRPAVGAALETVFAKALAKIPADRYPTASAFAEALANSPTVGSARKPWHRGAVVALAVFSIGIFIVAVAIRGTPAPSKGTGPPVRSIAVLPLENLTGDSSQVYLVDGMTDQLITDIAQVGTLKVIGRTSVMRYRGTRKPASQIAGELHVEAVLVGSLQRVGDALHLSVQLNAGSSGETLWAASYDGVVRDVLQLQREVARKVAEEIRVALSPIAERQFAKRARPVAPAAYDAYVRGRYWWNKRGAANLQRAIGFFQEALDLDPTYASAYSARADAYVQLGYGSYVAPDDAFPKAKAAAMTALQLDSTLAEPHAALGYYYLYYDWDWKRSDEEFQRALSINPSYPTAREWYGLYLAAVGRLQEAQAQVKQAVDLDPLSVPIASTAGWIAHYSGNDVEAETLLRRALVMDSTFPLGHLYLGRVYQSQGRSREAVLQFQATGPLRSWVPTLAGMGNLDAVTGSRAGARQVLAKLDSLARTEYVTPYGVALVYAGLGEKGAAFAWLDKAVDQRSHWLVWLNRDFRWNGLRSDPRFAALVRRVGLPN